MNRAHQVLPPSSNPPTCTKVPLAVCTAVRCSSRMKGMCRVGVAVAVSSPLLVWWSGIRAWVVAIIKVKVSHVSTGHDGCPIPFVHGSQGQDALATTIQGPGHFRNKFEFAKRGEGGTERGRGVHLACRMWRRSVHLSWRRLNRVTAQMI
jgi:hypothetical protein